MIIVNHVVSGLDFTSVGLNGAICPVCNLLYLWLFFIFCYLSEHLARETKKQWMSGFSGFMTKYPICIFAERENS